MENYNPNTDAEELRNAIKPKKDEDKIIKIIANRTNDQRQKIKETYNSLYKSDLIKDLQKALHGHFEDVVVALFYNPIDYDCYQLRKAVKGLGTDEEALIEILCTRPPDIIEAIKKRYSEMYPGRTLLKDVESDTSGHFRKVLVSLINAKRNNNKEFLDYAECEKCAKMLYEAGEKRLGTDEKVFTEIFTQKSPNEFTCIAQLYYKLTKHTLLQAVEKEFSRDSKKCLIAIIYALLNPSEFFAKCINKAVKGLGTDDNTLIRILVTRDEIDMPQIKQFYKQIYKKDMIEDIKDDTSGNYRKILVELASH
jgi:annexin A7/11